MRLMNRGRGALVSIAAAVVLTLFASCSANANGDPRVDPQKVAETAQRAKDRADEARDWVKEHQQEFTVSKKRYDASGYHLIASNGTDYILHLEIPFVTQAGKDPNRDAYEAIKKGDVLTVWIVTHPVRKEKPRLVLRIVNSQDAGG